MSEHPQTSANNETIQNWYQACKQTAVVAAVFSVLVLLLLGVNYLRARQADPLAPARLTALKAQLVQEPTNEQLKEDIRRVDQQLRNDYFRNTAFAEHGADLLLGGLAVFLLAMKLAQHLRQRLPNPKALPAENAGLSAQVGRRSVAIFGALAGGMLFAVALLGHGGAAGGYASMAVTPAVKAQAYPSAAEMAKNWPRFRGANGSGIAPDGTWPAHWDGAKGENILWKTAVPLHGENSPVVWGDRVFLSGADEHQREIYCFDANGGKLLWRQPVNDLSCADQTPLNVTDDTGYAAPTMATDGTHVFAMFANGDLACYDFGGKRVWAQNMGRPENTYGLATSLLTYQNLLILQFDQGDGTDGKSAVMALDAATGATVWKTKRALPNSWATPIIINDGKRDALITCGSPLVVAYDPASGNELWHADCLGGDVAPSPIFANGMLFACNTTANLAAIRPDGSGDVTKSHIAWMAQDGLPDLVSPLSNGKWVLLVMSDGSLTCYDAQKGNKLWEHALPNPVKSSPSLVGDKVYLLDEQGIMHIFTVDGGFHEVGTAALGENANTSPAFVNGRIYIRGKDDLYCIGMK